MQSEDTEPLFASLSLLLLSFLLDFAVLVRLALCALVLAARVLTGPLAPLQGVYGHAIINLKTVDGSSSEVTDLNNSVR